VRTLVASTAIVVPAATPARVFPAEPEVIVLIGPSDRAGACPVNIRSRRGAQGPIDTRWAPSRDVAPRTASTHPRPLTGRWGELPEVIQTILHTGGRVATASEQQYIPLTVCPGERGRPAPRQVRDGGYSLDSVDAGLVQPIAPTHPGQFVSSRCLRIGRQGEGEKCKGAQARNSRQ
jgi:hypothetical protein